MCSRWRALFAAALLVTPTALRGQGGAEERSRLRALLARADSLWALRVAEDSVTARGQRTARRAQLFPSGDVALALWGAVSSSEGDSMARAASAQLSEFGLVPGAFTRGVVVIQVNAADTAALRRNPAMGRRQPLLLDWVPGDPRGVEKVVYEITRAYARSLDSAASVWLPPGAGEPWSMDRGGERALRWLTESQTSAGSLCLAGDPAGCRRALGLEDAKNPLAARYTAGDIRHMLQEQRYGSARLQACFAGDDGSCLRFAEESRYAGLSPIPASEAVRTSVLRYVRATRGVDAVGRVFAGAPALMGARFARATGQGLDSLVLGWRAWVLSRGRPGRVRTPVGEALAALTFSGVLILLATRRTRWQ